MMRNPAHSRFCSSNAPSHHRNELPGADNSRSENMSPTVDKALMLESLPNEVNVVLLYVPVKPLK